MPVVEYAGGPGLIPVAMHTMLHGSFPRHLTGRSMPSGID